MAEDTAVATEEEVVVPTTDTAETPKRDALVYEVGYHVVPALGEEEVAAVAATVKGLIEKEGGTFISEELPRSMKLAYEIALSDAGTKQKYSDSYFGWVKFDAPQGVAALIKNALKAEKKLIRFCLFKTAREDTRAPKHLAMADRPERAQKSSLEPLAIERRTPVVEEPKQTTPLTDEEIDKTIEELIAE